MQPEELPTYLEARGLSLLADYGADEYRTRIMRGQGRWSSDLNPEAAALVMIAVLQGISLQLAWDENLDVQEFAKALKALTLPTGIGG